MYAACRAYLVDTLKASGIHMEPITSFKKLQLYRNSHVVIGEFSADQLGVIYQTFLEKIGRGLYVNGNFVSADPSLADWVEDEDSILAAKVAVKLKIAFTGGVYVDTDRRSLKDKELDIDYGQK